MSTAFAPDGSEPLGRRLARTRLRPESVSISKFYRLGEVERFLIGFEGFVALQLADSMLGDSVRIISELASFCPACSFCIIADSTFGEGDVDEVGAKHLDNQKIVHFGDANCKQTTTMDSLFIRVNPFLVDTFEKSLRKVISEKKNSDVIILSENDALLAEIGDFGVVTQLLHLDTFLSETGSENSLENKVIIYIGSKTSPKLIAWAMQNQPGEIVVICPNTGETHHNPVDLGRLLMQRFHLIERGKDAERVGLIIGSNGAHDLTLQCIHKLRHLAAQSGKTCYVIVVGEPTPQKLGNFPDIDIFVLIGSPELSILPAKGFYKPVIHPWEFMMAASGKEWDGKFCVNWALFLDQKIDIELKENDISLITGKIRTTTIQPDVDENTGQVSVIGKREIARIEAHAAKEGKEYFGLSQPTQTGPSQIREGTVGIAAQYKHEEKS